MQVFVNYPHTEEGRKELLDNLATFKAELFLKCIENLTVEEQAKEKILEKVLEILNDKPSDSVI